VTRAAWATLSLMSASVLQRLASTHHFSRELSHASRRASQRPQFVYHPHQENPRHVPRVRGWELLRSAAGLEAES
jgi:hypothetical protein